MNLKQAGRLWQLLLLSTRDGNTYNPAVYAVYSRLMNGGPL